jgi:hypothetical protein
MAGQFPPELQVRQYVAEVTGARGSRWRVFRTGSDRHYLFSSVDNPTFSVPVLKTSLRDDVRSALANGYGHA